MSTDDAILRDARERVSALRAWLQAHNAQPVRLIETHISWVLLTDTLAFKLKKPVRLPFLDFTTLAARRHYCEEELRLNRRLAPSLYLDVVDVCEGPCIDGAGPAIDVALRMRRFADGALWSEQVDEGRLTAQHIDAMAKRLHDFHCVVPVASTDSIFGSATVRGRITHDLIGATDAWCAAASSSSATRAWPALRAWLLEQLAALAPWWQTRRIAGRVRECHGDLHLANVLQLGDQSTAFDAIEFDPTLRWIDVIDDIAFLAMDLSAHGERRLAWRFVNAYLEASGDYDGMRALRYFMVCRALVRARVMALTDARRSDATNYVELAAAIASGADARLAITHGLPGSGKTFMSQAVIEHAGAIRVRSDVERKRLFGLDALATSHDKVASGIYDAATTARTYARLHDVARGTLEAGWPVVVDAAFLRRDERAQFAALAHAMAVPFTILDCRAPWALLRRRLAQRRSQGGDASEADEDVLDRLRDVDQPLDKHEIIVGIVADAEQPVAPAQMAHAWLAARAGLDGHVGVQR